MQQGAHMKMRQEHDLLGTRDVPAEAYYGIQTQRALENFQISGVRLSQFSTFIQAFALVKKAAAIANAHCKILNETQKNAIIHACDLLLAGKYHEQFPVDMFQGGAGTSTNMNVNEVIANLALEQLGKEKGDYKHLHPNNHVNASQSTNDAYPTAIHIALDNYLERLFTGLEHLKSALEEKAQSFKGELKMGRTHLQDAVPMTAEQEFNAFATIIKKELKRLSHVRKELYEINMGATAIGTMLNAPKGYAEKCVATLRELTQKPYHLAEDLIEATQDTSPYVALSGTLRLIATRLSKIANDLRLQSSGPRAGLQNYQLPERQPGSSIMPGKVNPVIPEVVNQTCFHIMGIDHSIALAAEAGQLQLNVFEPIIAFNLFTGINMLAKVSRIFADYCIKDIKHNQKHNHEQVLNNIGLITALSPHIGYEASSKIARLAQQTGGSIYQLILDEKLLDKKELDRLISPENMV